MHRPEGVIESGVNRTGIDQIGQAELSDAPQSLKKWVLNDIKYERGVYSNKPVNRVLDDLFFIQNFLLSFPLNQKL